MKKEKERLEILFHQLKSENERLDVLLHQMKSEKERFELMDHQLRVDNERLNGQNLGLISELRQWQDKCSMLNQSVEVERTKKAVQVVSRKSREENKLKIT